MSARIPGDTTSTQSGIPLAVILGDEKSEIYNAFCQHASKGFAMENIRFIKAVDAGLQAFADDPSHADALLRMSFNKINNTYIAGTAHYEINISADIKNKIEQAVQDMMAPDMDLNKHPNNAKKLHSIIMTKIIQSFTEAKGQVISLLETDVYPRFILTEEYKKIVSSQQAMTGQPIQLMKNLGRSKTSSLIDSVKKTDKKTIGEQSRSTTPPSFRRPH